MVKPELLVRMRGCIMMPFILLLMVSFIVHYLKRNTQNPPLGGPKSHGSFQPWLEEANPTTGSTCFFETFNRAFREQIPIQVRLILTKLYAEYTAYEKYTIRTMAYK